MPLSRKLILSAICLALLAPLSALAKPSCKGNVCNVPPPVTTPGMYDDDNIEAIIAEAEAGNYRHVKFPAGTYTVTRSIIFNDTHYDMFVFGAGPDKTIIKPAILDPDANVPFFPIFNFAQGAGFTSMKFKLKGFTIDMDELRTHPAYFDRNRTTANAHAIRVGQGWGVSDPDGWMTIQDMIIKGAPGYGIGIQTRGRAEPANNVWIENVQILNSGSDGIDTKESQAGEGQNLTIIGVLVDGFGLNEKDPNGATTSAKAFDIRYQSIYMEKVTAIGDGVVTSAAGGSLTRNDGINFRDAIAHGDKIADRLAMVRDFYVEGTDNAVNFGSSVNRDVILTNFIMQDYVRNGFNVRGAGHVLEHGCVLPGSEPNSNFVTLVSGQHTPGTIVQNFDTGAYDAEICPAYEDVGFAAYTPSADQ